MFQVSSGIKSNEGPRQFRYEYVEFPFTLQLYYKVPTLSGSQIYDCKYKVELKNSGSWKIQLYNK